jgi:hypothetical protein
MAKILRNNKGKLVMKFTDAEREEFCDSHDNRIMDLLEVDGLKVVIDFADWALEEERVWRKTAGRTKTVRDGISVHQLGKGGGTWGAMHEFMRSDRRKFNKENF